MLLRPLLLTGSFTNHHNNGSASYNSSNAASTAPSRSTSRGRCISQAGQYLPSSHSHNSSRPPRSITPPPRAVAVPLDQQVLNPDTDFSLDLVKAQFKCTYATAFGQELRIVGGAPELGAWDVTQVLCLSTIHHVQQPASSAVYPSVIQEQMHGSGSCDSTACHAQAQVEISLNACLPQPQGCFYSCWAWPDASFHLMRGNLKSSCVLSASLHTVCMQAPAMTWNSGHAWMMNAFLPPGTYPFKIVVYTPGSRPEAARWENGPNRSVTIAADSPELGTAALVLVECQFDQTQHTNTQTKRVTGIGFKATAGRGNPHLSTSSNGSSGAAGGLPSAHAMAANAGADGGYRAAMMAAAGIPTSKVTANAIAAQQHQQHQQQYQQQQYQQQPEPLSAAAPAAAAGGGGAAHMPGTEAFNSRIADLDSRLAALLAQNGKGPAVHNGYGNSNGTHSPAEPHTNAVEAPAAAAAAVQPPAVAVPVPAAPAAAAAKPPAAPTVAAPPPAAAAAAAVGTVLGHEAPPEVRAAAATCKEDPGAADACRVVTKFITGVRQDRLTAA